MLLPSNTSTNKIASPGILEDSPSGLLIDVPANPGATSDHQKNFALVTSMVLCNKSSGNIAVYAKIVNGSTTGFLLHNLDLPSSTSYDVIVGNKITLKEGDKLYVWYTGSSANLLDVIFSYTLHRPLTTYDI
jgi:hypothetical protein